MNADEGCPPLRLSAARLLPADRNIAPRHAPRLRSRSAVVVAAPRRHPMPRSGRTAPHREVGFAVAIDIRHERDVAGGLAAPLLPPLRTVAVSARRGQPEPCARRPAPDHEIGLP